MTGIRAPRGPRSTRPESPSNLLGDRNELEIPVHAMQLRWRCKYGQLDEGGDSARSVRIRAESRAEVGTYVALAARGYQRSSLRAALTYVKRGR